MRGIMAIDIGGRISFGITLSAALLSGRHRKPIPPAPNTRKDIIACAVKNTAHRYVDAVTSQRFYELILIIGTPPATAASYDKLLSIFIRQRGKPRSMRGQQSLVGGDEMFAAVERSLGRFHAKTPLRAANKLKTTTSMPGILRLRLCGIVDPFDAGQIAIALLPCRVR